MPDVFPSSLPLTELEDKEIVTEEGESPASGLEDARTEEAMVVGTRVWTLLETGAAETGGEDRKTDPLGTVDGLTAGVL